MSTQLVLDIPFKNICGTIAICSHRVNRLDAGKETAAKWLGNKVESCINKVRRAKECIPQWSRRSYCQKVKEDLIRKTRRLHLQGCQRSILNTCWENRRRQAENLLRRVQIATRLWLVAPSQDLRSWLLILGGIREDHTVSARVWCA